MVTQHWCSSEWSSSELLDHQNDALTVRPLLFDPIIQKQLNFLWSILASCYFLFLWHYFLHFIYFSSIEKIRRKSREENLWKQRQKYFFQPELPRYQAYTLKMPKRNAEKNDDNDKPIENKKPFFSKIPAKYAPRTLTKAHCFDVVWACWVSFSFSDE